MLGSSLQIVLQLLTTCFCKVYYLDFYLTLHHTTKKLQEDHDAVTDHSLRKQETENGLTVHLANYKCSDAASVWYFPD